MASVEGAASPSSGTTPGNGPPGYPPPAYGGIPAAAPPGYPGYPPAGPPGYPGYPPPGYPAYPPGDAAKVDQPPSAQGYAYAPPQGQPVAYGGPISQADLLDQTTVQIVTVQQMNPCAHVCLIIVSILCPLAGWIMFCCMNATYPTTARACCWAATISFTIALIVSLATGT
jgi:hypothetical protein